MSSWKSVLKRALQTNFEKMGPSATYVSLATVRQDNTPAVRTVVIRGFAGEHHSQQTGWESDLLVVTTNKRSRKMEEIANNNKTEINWFMRATRQEFRLAGDIHIIPNDDHGSLLQEHFTRSNHPEGDSLALKAFQLTQANDFSWQAERLRQFIQLDGSMRATFVTDCPVTSLEITHIGEDGWFLNAQYQHLLDQAFDNFVLLVIKVDSMDHIQL